MSRYTEVNTLFEAMGLGPKIPAKTITLKTETIAPETVFPEGVKDGAENILHLKAGNSNFYAIKGAQGHVYVSDNLKLHDTGGFVVNDAEDLFEVLLSFFKFAEDKETA